MSLQITTYNCRGLKTGQNQNDYSNRLVLEQLFTESDIICLQETWLSKQDLDKLNSINPDYHGIGESTTDTHDRMIQGRISGGVAILWNIKHESQISELRLEKDWAVGIVIQYEDRKVVIINVYMPYESRENDDLYMDLLA